jgi:hypothetical protein
MAEQKTKSNSLLESGFTIDYQSDAKDKNGLEIVAVVYKPFFIKKTKRGNLKAYRTLDGTVETTIEGLYNFQSDGKDLVGKRLESTSAKTAA